MSALKFLTLFLCMFISCVPDSNNGDSTFFIKVHAGDYHRHHSVAVISIDQQIEDGVYHLINEDGDRIPVQIDGREMTFLLPDLSAHSEIVLELVSATPGLFNNTGIRFFDDAIELHVAGGQPVLQYRTGPKGLDLTHVDEVFYRSGYIHPLFTPDGRAITEHYTNGRPHQNGIWTGWYKTEWNGLKPDFWSQAERTGKVEVFSVNKVNSGPVFSELKTTHHFNEEITEHSSTIVSDTWSVRVYRGFTHSKKPLNIFDLNVVQSNVTEYPLRLIEHVYGGIGFRGNDYWLGEEKMSFLTSEGENRAEAHHSKARWVAMSGEIGGEPASIIILAHPDNPRFPEPVFINQREPFFTFAPLQDGDLVLNPGDQFKAKYRYITMDGELPPPDQIEDYWKDYANPVQVIILK